METGLGYHEAMDLSLGELIDICAAFAVRSGRCTLKGTATGNDNEFWSLMERM